MSLHDDILGTLRAVRRELRSPVFLWKGREVGCVPQSNANGSTIAVGGFEVTVAFRMFVIPQEWFTVDTTLVTIDSTLYTSDNSQRRPVVGKTIDYIGPTRRASGLVLGKPKGPTGPTADSTLITSDSGQVSADDSTPPLGPVADIGAFRRAYRIAKITLSADSGHFIMDMTDPDR